MSVETSERLSNHQNFFDQPIFHNTFGTLGIPRVREITRSVVYYTYFQFYRDFGENLGLAQGDIPSSLPSDKVEQLIMESFYTAARPNSSFYDDMRKLTGVVDHFESAKSIISVLLEPSHPLLFFYIYKTLVAQNAYKPNGEPTFHTRLKWTPRIMPMTYETWLEDIHTKSHQSWETGLSDITTQMGFTRIPPRDTRGRTVRYKGNLFDADPYPPKKH